VSGAVLGRVQPQKILYKKKRKNTMSKKPMLKEILRDLIKISEFCQGNRQEVKLSGGLKISIVKFGEDYHLELARDNNKPSAVEWEVVIKNMPEFEYRSPTIKNVKGTYYFTGILNKKGFQPVRNSQLISNPNEL
jgi:hypothetical protein